MITFSDDNSHKIKWLEGLRGLAAVQVILLHYTQAFLPMLGRVEGPAHWPWEAPLAQSPLFFFIDGYSAVYLFFLMSGFVLAQSFSHSTLTVPRQTLKRFLRLYLPVLAAAAVAFILLRLFPYAKDQAYALSHSGFLHYNSQNPQTPLGVLRDFFLNSMLLGYRGTSVFDSIGFIKPWLMPLSMSLDGPFWSLHIEFWGSLLTLGLMTLRKRAHLPWFWFACGLLLIFLGTYQLILFVLGILIYLLAQTKPIPTHRVTTFAGVALIAIGMYTCGTKGVWLFERFFTVLLHVTVLHNADNFYWQSELGAILIFCGTMLCRPAQNLLATRPIQWLGKISFSLYLIHFPILYTLSAALFVPLAAISYALAFVGVTATGFLLTIAMAVLFERYVDKTAIVLSQRAARGA